mgnify:FL=1
MSYLFSNPGVLWGLVAIAIPVAIHLLLRRKPVVEHWGATRFLKKVIERKRAQLQVQSYFQLFVRMAILCLIILAAADPRIDSAGVPTNSTQNVHRLLIVDVSMSMGADRNGESRLEEVRRQITSLVSRSSPGDSWQLILHGSDETPIRFRIPTYDAKLLIDELVQLSPSSQSANLLETMQRATHLIEEFPGTQNEVLFWTDLSSHDWQYRGSAEYELNARFEQFSQTAKVSLIDVAGDDQANIALTDLSIDSDHIFIGENANVTATIKNFSSKQQLVTAQLFMDQEGITEQSVALEPYESRDLEFRVVMNRAGIAQCDVQIGNDPLNADNSRSLVFLVNDTFRVLIIEEELSSTDLKQSDFLQLALAAGFQQQSVEAVASSPKYAVSTVTPALFRNSSLETYDVLIVCGLSNITAIDAQRFSDFVQKGGGILFTMSDEISIRDYNEQLGRSGNGLIPVHLLSKVTMLESDLPPFQIGQVAPEIPLIEPFELHPTSGLKTTRIYSYVDTKNEIDQNSQSILTLENDSPLMVSHSSGLGKVYLVTTAFNTEWGSWVLWPSFLPLVQRLIDDLASRESLIVNSIIGNEIPSSVVDREQYSVIQNSAGEILVEGEFSEEDSHEIFNVILNTPGIYSLRNTEDQLVQIVQRYVDTIESDLRHLQHAKLLSSSLFKELEISLIDDVSKLVLNRRSLRLADDSNLARWLLFAAVVLVFIDQIYMTRPAAALGALLGISVSGLITVYLHQTPFGKILFVAICTLSSAYLGNRIFSKRQLSTHPPE